MQRKLSNVSSRFGAPPGRPCALPENPATAAPLLYLQKMKWVDGDYDEGGAYWGGGSGDFIYHAFGEFNGEEVELFVRALDRGQAMTKVLERIPHATFFGSVKPAPLNPKIKRLQLKLKPPFMITARLLPGLKVEDGFISIEYSTLQGRESRTRYHYYIDIPAGEFDGEDLQSGVGGGDLQEGMESLLAFLSSGSSHGYFLRSGRKPDDDETELFPKPVVEWAYQNSEELECLRCEIEENKDLIQENSK